jgi:RecB family exonuclease
VEARLRARLKGAMSLGIEEILRPALGDRSVRFVFPSEICAEAWLSRALASSWGPRALEADRFLGWDRYKELAAGSAERSAVDDALRRIFAASVLADNERAPFLESIVPPDYAGEWRAFAGYVASRLPALGSLPSALRATGRGPRGGPAGRDPALADWLALRERYEAFLRGIGRIEPSFEPRALRSLPGTTAIFFPELIEDFDEYREALGSAALAGEGSLRLVGLPESKPSVSLRRPATALAELREALSEAGELLEGGMEAADIAITVADLERYRPYLEREAELLSLPISLRAGRNLAATPGGRLFAALRDAYASDFSFDSLRDLLYSPAWPWKSPEIVRGIVDEGQRRHAIASWTEGGRRKDAWNESLPRSLAAEYQRLRRSVTAITGAKDFPSLLKSYNVFKSEFLSREEGDWDARVNLSLARCVVELEKLVGAEREAKEGAGVSVPDPFSLFMRVLESEIYVSAAGSAGIPVYDWRVAAGIFPRRHFILGASQDALSVPYRGLDFLGPELREALRPERDAAGDFIAAYARSGGEVSFTCPEEGLDGEVAAHGLLLTLAGGPGAEAPPPRAAPRIDAAYREEAAWLSGRGGPPARLHGIQRRGREAAEASARGAARGPGDDGAFLEPRTAARAAARLRREGETLASLDSTAIDYYRSCPYAYLYLRLLKASPEESGISFVDDFFIGDVYHAALERLFERVRAEDGRFKPERTDAYLASLGSCLDEAFDGLARSRGPFVAVILEAYRDVLEEHLALLVGAEAERFPGLEVGPLEAELELPYPELAGGVVLRGRIDRLSRSDRGEVIVDYKKGRIPRKAEVAPDDSGAIANAQIPCYLRLVVGAGGAAAVDSAWYLSIEGYGELPPASYACAFGEADEKGRGAYVPRASLDAFVGAFDAALAETARGIAAGSFPFAPKGGQAEACRDCGARGICRERYALRFRSRGVGA